jgi:hypothetical protein
MLQQHAVTAYRPLKLELRALKLVSGDQHALTGMNSENYWVFGLFPSSGILENTTFRKPGLFSSSGEGRGDDTYSVGPLRKS